MGNGHSSPDREWFSPFLLNDSSPLLWQKFEKKFQSEKAAGSVSKSTQFEYAWCLVRSKYNDDIRKGIALLEGEVLGYLPPTSQLPSGSGLLYCHWPRSLPASRVLGLLNKGPHSYFIANSLQQRAVLSLTSPLSVLLANYHLIV